MDANTLIIKLNNLAHVDIAAYHAYRKSTEVIRDDIIRKTFRSFQKDYEKHVESLANAVKELNGQPITFNRDLKSFLVEAFNRDFKNFLTSGYIPIRNITSDINDALKAMEKNENIANESYEKAPEEDLPQEIKRTIKAHIKKQKKHLLCIHKTIKEIDEFSSFTKRRLPRG